MPIKPDDLNRNKNGNGNNQDKDDFVSSSFAVQFKPGDKASSVSDKLKGNPNEVEDEFDSFKDEFDDFVFDESVSAFKPIDSEEAVKSAFVPRGGVAPKEVNVKPDTSAEKKGADIPAFPKNGGTFDRRDLTNPTLPYSAVKQAAARYPQQIRRKTRSSSVQATLLILLHPSMTRTRVTLQTQSVPELPFPMKSIHPRQKRSLKLRHTEPYLQVLMLSALSLQITSLKQQRNPATDLPLS